MFKLHVICNQCEKIVDETLSKLKKLTSFK